MIFLSFLSNTVFSIVIPSLPHFLEEVGAPAYLNGWAVAANSAGTFLASPLLGWWSDRRGVKEVHMIPFRSPEFDFYFGQTYCS